ncbi:Uncharacterized protein ACS0PU_012768 [Formica fusca]|uniref:uncharacterized protein C19orf47 homolog n=1 Tax=Formica exsecta TaxID=72781 RepID=UPI001144A645|nr:uncharacterized protein C19orf47 homolog [Formica exsecta]
MAASLSAYWVKFFKGAGFPQDVATKHAVVFSNNRIKPDMLPDLDKPSLKEMGITLMGDMIAILRYAKKVVEETTCERFLVDTEDVASAPKVNPKPVAKKVIKEIGNKTMVSLASKTDSTKKIVKPLPTTAKKIMTIKKPISVSNTNNTTNQKQTSMKRKLVSEEVYEDDDDNWNIVEKKVKATNGKDNTIEYTVTVPKSSSVRTQVLKKPVEQKRTVFDRLGDSSVTSTTNLADTTPTFNITGVSKDVFKRSNSVFKRLGDIDDKRDHVTTAGILKNGSGITSSSGILKNPISPSIRTSIVTTKRVIPKTTGTMHADHEVNKKIVLNNTSRILKVKKESDVRPSSERIIKPAVTSGKLASERLISIPAKARLGTTTAKQVTFSKVATVTHVKRADVFSRLGL